MRIMPDLVLHVGLLLLLIHYFEGDNSRNSLVTPAKQNKGVAFDHHRRLARCLGDHFTTQL